MKTQQIQTTIETLSEVVETVNQTEHKSVFMNTAIANLNAAKQNLEKESRRVKKLKRDML